MRSNQQKDNYNDIPVHYCKNCLSLKIRTVVVNSDLEYCDECGGTDIDSIHIEEWEKLFKERYGFNYLTNISNNGREKTTYL